MFAFLLGLSWLVLTPICIWRLFGREQSRLARATGVLTLAALEATTLAVGWAEQPPSDRPATAPAMAASSGPHSRPSSAPSSVPSSGPGTTPTPAPSPTCATRTPAPESVRLTHRPHQGVQGMTIYWTATSEQCGTATVTYRRAGRQVRIWLDEGAAGRDEIEGRESRTLPVHVAEGRATLDLTLMPPLRPGPRYVAVDGRTGHRIPERRPTNG
ncbi:hypothetical protein Misp02_53400 [Microtetraspora sp. NBRC 16547]|nr:hypothetical protein Misp02_53400 [Microtetraspora sp. NBRC 16547]